MDISASNKLTQENMKKWEELHRKSSSESVRITPSYAIKRICENRQIIQTNSTSMETLEIGCGFGRNLFYLINHNFSDHYIGIDQTDVAIEQSSELLGEYRRSGIVEIIKANAGERLPFPLNSFDCIFDIMSAITFIPDDSVRKNYFKNVAGLLKSGGSYFFLAVRKEGVFNDKISDPNLPDSGLFKRKFDNMIEKSYSRGELLNYLSGLSPKNLDVVSEHTRAFGDEHFEREGGFWFGCFTKDM